jgi:hypothetical protein
LGTTFPFSIRETEQPDASAAAIFRRAFRCEPPAEPRHFSAILDRDGAVGEVVGYVHFIPFQPGIYLCGGLCVDARSYRGLSKATRDAVASHGSLARWLLAESIAALGPKEAVCAYTGDTRSRRDVLALGFEPTPYPYLLVKWHDAAPVRRLELLQAVAALGAF